MATDNGDGNDQATTMIGAMQCDQVTGLKNYDHQGNHDECYRCRYFSDQYEEESWSSVLAAI